MKRTALAFALSLLTLSLVANAGSMGKKDIVDTAVAAGDFKTLAAALKAAGKRFAVHVYPNVNHAFNNDTSNRYDKPAADLAWNRSIAFFKENLGAPPKA